MTSPREAPATEEQPRRTLRVGARVEVRNRFDGSWSAGFEVSAVVDGGYRIRRRGDGSELPGRVRRRRRPARAALVDVVDLNGAVGHAWAQSWSTPAPMTSM